MQYKGGKEDELTLWMWIGGGGGVLAVKVWISEISEEYNKYIFYISHKGFTLNFCYSDLSSLEIKDKTNLESCK